MVLGHVAGLAAAFSLTGDVPVQEVSAARLRRSIETDPFLDGTPADIVLDDPSALAGAGWERVFSHTGYGPSCLEHRGDPASGEVTYNLPDSLSGAYDLYSYEQKWCDRNAVSSGLPADLTQRKTFLLSGFAQAPGSVSFDGEGFTVYGQTAGDWWKIGRVVLEKGRSAQVRIRAEEGAPTRADALMLVKTKQTK